MFKHVLIIMLHVLIIMLHILIIMLHILIIKLQAQTRDWKAVHFFELRNCFPTVRLE